MANRDDISIDYVRQLFSVNAEVGEIFWNGRPRNHFNSSSSFVTWNKRFAGKKAGGINKSHGYRQVGIDGRLRYAHRIVWAFTHGAWPDGEIDHINGDRSDNRISNLRVASRSDNAANISAPSHNTSGVKGVSWAAHASKWRAMIQVNGRSVHIGYFADINEARAAYERECTSCFGEFAKL